MTVTIELPRELAEQAAAAGITPEEVDRFAAVGAVSALTTAVALSGRAKEQQEYAGRIALLLDAAEPRDAGEAADPALLSDLAEAAAEMEAGTKAGRLMTPEQVGGEADAFLAARRAQRTGPEAASR